MQKKCDYHLNEINCIIRKKLGYIPAIEINKS